MNSTLSRISAVAAARPASARTALALISQLRHGTLELDLPDGHRRVCGRGGPRVDARLSHWNALARVLRSGDIGFAEGFVAGEWDSSDLTALLRMLLRNRSAIEPLVYGSWAGRLLHRIRHALNRNTRRGSSRNIPAHYDLGNAFYTQWLDETMNYSGAWFEGDLSGPLPQAQQAKTRRALREAGVAPGARVLEIGCGWGALAETAASEFGAHVTGITLSTEQLAWAGERVQARGLQGQCDLRLQDYRDLPTLHAAGSFDAIVSIEMFEAVGQAYWDTYFGALRHCLKPGGRACLQSITIRDDLFDRYRASSDFIQQYIFPGGFLPSTGAFEALARRHGFDVEGRLAFGADYAETLRRWRDAFMRREPQIRALGFDDYFLRLWQFYLCYCEAAFDEGNTDVVQFTLRRN
jgi:cyclopropane-fatty-acyl-phospholipid synthase